MSGIGVILNPHSRSNRKNPGRVKRFSFIVGDKGSCHETHDLHDVDRAAHDFCERGIDVLGISGGDGTLHKTLTAVVKAYGEKPLPKIAFLRGGTMNNVAGTVGVKGTPEKILADLLLNYHEGRELKSTEVNLLKVNEQYGFIFGMGVMPRFLEKYEDTKRELSPIRAATTLGHFVLSSMMNGKAAQWLCERFDAKIIVDQQELPFKNYNFLIGGTIESLTLGFRPLYRTRKLTNQFQFIGISATPRHLTCILPTALMMRPIKSECFTDAVGRRVVIECKEPQIYAIDGDRPEKPVDRIELSLGPRLICILP